MNFEFNIAICGCISSGKSTFMNALLRYNVNKMSKIKSTLTPIKYICNPHYINLDKINPTEYIKYICDLGTKNKNVLNQL